MQAFKVSCNDEMRVVPLKKDAALCLALLVHHVALKFQRHPSTFRLASPDLAYEPVRARYTTQDLRAFVAELTAPRRVLITQAPCFS